ncbi:TIGR00282 family metallophosphoesterase [Vampirovibrio chlorellavorus]|uniref:TIGR00282 family metallophosphoesterase n=1 Tax=Vampirovibrio chlorellavorus TaxID=758823 RepID=UPI0026EBFC61|nr:TIGR00282 family metallophosphoesterase [Vampirovibrio chlorellavorus]
MDSKTHIELLFFGDLVGKPGRTAVKAYLDSLSERPDVVIANGENISHGFGMIRKHYDEMREAGVDIFTSGNHIWDQKEVFNFIDEVNLLRPYNFPAASPGRGARIFEVAGCEVGVINLIGQVFMGNYNSPWEQFEELVYDMLAVTPIIFLDFHAEATAEKIAMAWHASSLGVSAMTGTHTHVQTADSKILNNRMGYITDTGFNGSYNSVIGMEASGSLQRLKSHLPTRLDVGPDDILQVNAVKFTIEVKTGVCRKVERINEVFSHNGEPLQPFATR